MPQYALYIAAGLGIACAIINGLSWLAGRFPICGNKCQCEFRTKR